MAKEDREAEPVVEPDPEEEEPGQDPDDQEPRLIDVILDEQKLNKAKRASARFLRHKHKQVLIHQKLRQEYSNLAGTGDPRLGKAWRMKNNVREVWMKPNVPEIIWETEEEPPEEPPDPQNLPNLPKKNYQGSPQKTKTCRME